MMPPLSSLSDPRYVNRQYQSANNLNARIRLHQRFSTNPYGWSHWVFDQLPLTPGSDVLELGCGTADLWRDNLERIPPGVSLLLSDLSEGMVQQAQHNLLGSGQHFAFRVIDAQSIPLEDQRFDLVIANHMLFHLPDRPKALREIRRVLKPGGTLVATSMGITAMQELSDLVARFDPQLTGYGKLEAVTFTLENGAAQLERFFEQVQLLRYEDDLLVTEVEPLIDYLLSGRLELTPDRQAALIDFVRQEFESNGGNMYIHKDAGLFKAR